MKRLYIIRLIFLEYFLVVSWVEHLRQHDRVTHADADVQKEARAFHLFDEAPKVSHWLAPRIEHQK